MSLSNTLFKTSKPSQKSLTTGLMFILTLFCSLASTSINATELTDSRYPNLDIVSAPVDLTVRVGETAQFSVEAVTNSTRAIRYRWFHNRTRLDGQTDSSLIIENVQAEDAGIYKVKVRARKTREVLKVRLNVEEPVTPTEIEINASPVSVSVTEGEQATFSVTASTNDDTAVSYQWFVDGSTIAGANSSTLTLNPTSLDDAGVYRVVMNAGEASANASATLTVNELVIPTEIEINASPASVSVTEGEQATFSVAASTNDDTAVSYQWFVDGSTIAGANSSTLTLNPTSLDDAGVYRVVMNAGEASANASATLTVNELVIPTEIEINASPVSVSVTEGEQATFSVAASTNDDTAVSYQWFVDGSTIPGANSSTLTLNPTSLEDAGVYRVVMNAGEASANASATLTVNELVIPTEIEIVSSLDSIEVEEGAYAMFSVVATTNDGTPIAYSWYFNGNLIAGETRDFYSIDQSALQNSGQYTVLVSAGDVEKSISANLTVVEPELPPFYPIEISLQPSSVSAFVNESVTLNVSAISEQPMTYQWRKNGENIEGASKAYLSLNSLQLYDGAQYDVVITNGTDIVTSQKAILDVSNLPNIQLSWSLPTEREDGTELLPEEISGFNIYVTEQYSNEAAQLTVEGLITDLDLGQLERGRYEFAIATLDASGVEGAQSEAIIVDVN